ARYDVFWVVSSGRAGIEISGVSWNSVSRRPVGTNKLTLVYRTDPAGGTKQQQRCRRLFVQLRQRILLTLPSILSAPGSFWIELWIGWARSALTRDVLRENNSISQFDTSQWIELWIGWARSALTRNVLRENNSISQFDTSQWIELWIGWARSALTRDNKNLIHPSGSSCGLVGQPHPQNKTQTPTTHHVLRENNSISQFDTSQWIELWIGWARSALTRNVLRENNSISQFDTSQWIELWIGWARSALTRDKYYGRTIVFHSLIHPSGSSCGLVGLEVPSLATVGVAIYKVLRENNSISQFDTSQWIELWIGWARSALTRYSGGSYL
ncbi:hypothetical protein J6590_051855, partial [Homalodisca vitripennis]